MQQFEGYENINAFTISEDGMRVPYWFMNYEDFEYLFEPSPGTQAPILKKALGLLKNENIFEKKEESLVRDYEIQCLVRLYNACEPLSSEFKNLIYYHSLEYMNFEILKKEENLKKILTKLSATRENELKKSTNNWINGEISLEIRKNLKLELTNVLNKITSSKVKSCENIDLPKYFNFNDLINNGLDEAIKDIEENQNKYREYISSLKLRLASFMSDLRKSEPLLFNEKDIENSLEIFFKYIFGSKELTAGNLFAEYKNKNDTSKRKNQIIILDLSLIPFELLETITGLIGRLILEFAQRINKVEDYKEERGNYPISLILEEAQNYIPEVDKNNKKSITKKVFERIAREGRKFGVSLIVSSQRPSELSKTILSQCNTFIVHKLQNPEDQKYIRQIVSSANEDLLNQLPILPQQHAIIMGEAVRTPSQLRINDITSKPDSNNPKFIENWLEESNKIEINKVVKKWLEEKEETISTE